MAKILLTYFFLTCILATTYARQHAHAPSMILSPSPSITPKAPSSSTSSDDQCSSIVYNMMDCISYLSDGSTDTKPEASCCSGFELVVAANVMCLCNAIESSANMGIELNMTRVSGLSSDCGHSTNSFKSCKMHYAIAPSTITSPANAPEKPNMDGKGTNILAPAPSPSSGISIQSASLIILMIIIFVGFI